MKTNYKNILLSLAVIALFSCSTNEESNSEELILKDESPKTEKPSENSRVLEEEKSIQVTGIIDAPPQNLITISTPMGGFVKSTSLLEGQKVKKGQLLLSLQHQDYIALQQDYLQKKNDLKLAELEFDRQQKLNDENVNAKKTFQKAESEYNHLKIEVESLSQKLNLIGISTKNLTAGKISSIINIYSPSKGFVSKVNVNLGKYVNSSDPLVDIVNTQHLHAELTVFEKDVTKLKVGQKITFTFPNEAENDRTATIHLIGKSINENRAVKVHAHLDEEDENLLPGMFINARIEL